MSNETKSLPVLPGIIEVSTKVGVVYKRTTFSVNDLFDRRELDWRMSLALRDLYKDYLWEQAQVSDLLNSSPNTSKELPTDAPRAGISKEGDTDA